MAKIRVLHGPNLNLLGQREPALYGRESLADIDAALVARGAGRGCEVECFQSNAEHVLVEHVQAAPGDGVDFIICNPAAFTHTSVALRDAFLAVEVPFIEVHLSNVLARESWRRRSYFSDIAAGVILGLGSQGYRLALDAAVERVAGGAGRENPAEL